MTSAHRLKLLALFFVSGISGLVYQVIWIRQFGYVFGNTVYSAALVTSVFMAGLGLGSLGAGTLADRWFEAHPGRLVRAYAACELVIALFGLGLALLLPNLGALSAITFGYQVGPEGWAHPNLGSYVWINAIAMMLVFPCTFAMGATLSLLVRALVPADLASAGWQVSLLYGANTAGAALGALLTDTALVPSLGLVGAQGVAVALNLLAGLGALRLARGGPVVPPTPAPEDPTGPATSDPEPRGVMTGASVAIALAGFAGMGMEILWFRYLTSLLGGFRAVLSLLLAVILVGIWLGAFGAGGLHRRFGRARLLFVLSQAGFLLTAMGLFLSFGHESIDWSARRLDVGALDQLRFNLVPIVLVVAVPALFMGATFPLANAHTQRVAGRVGRRAGGLYLANTLGGVLGALLGGFVLLPAFGMQGTVLVLGGATALGMIAFVAPRPKPLGLWLPALAVSLALLGWAALPADHLIRRQFPDLGPGRYLHMVEGVNETIGVSETHGMRVLYTNGHAMSATIKPAQRYMRAFSHVPLLHSDAPENVLVICFGVGNTTHAASLHPSVQRIDVADLSQDVLQSAHYFETWNKGVIEDPRVRVHVVDGRQHLRAPGPAYDLVTLEPPPIAFAGVSALYSREFYALARARLKPGGLMTQWLPIYQLPPEAALSLVRAFVDVFPNAILLSGWRNELLLMGSNAETMHIEPEALARRLRERPQVQDDLQNVSMGGVIGVLGSFAGSATTLTEATAHVAPVSDDWPVLEYAVRSALVKHPLPASVFRPAGIRTWCPSCSPERTPELFTYLRLMDAYYRSDDFLSGETGGRLDVDCTAPAIAALRAESPYLDHVIGCAGR